MEIILGFCIGIGLSVVCGFCVFVLFLVMSFVFILGWFEFM